MNGCFHINFIRIKGGWKRTQLTGCTIWDSSKFSAQIVIHNSLHKLLQIHSNVSLEVALTMVFRNLQLSESGLITMSMSERMSKRTYNRDHLAHVPAHLCYKLHFIANSAGGLWCVWNSHMSHSTLRTRHSARTVFTPGNLRLPNQQM